MPKVATTSNRGKSPFKDKGEIRDEVISYLNKFRVTVSFHCKKISTYFEMNCYTHIIKFYERSGYTVNGVNLQAANRFKIKCVPSGIQSNFSFFSISKIENGEEFSFEIHQNLGVQSSHDIELFTNPDIVVINENSCEYTRMYHDTKTAFSFVRNENLISFFEVKNFHPFPELIFNFIGVVNELRKEVMVNKGVAYLPIHLAPSLLVSGKPNAPTLRIKKSLESRYCINILYDIFHSGTSTFSKKNLNKLKTTGRIFN